MFVDTLYSRLASYPIMHTIRLTRRVFFNRETSNGAFFRPFAFRCGTRVLSHSISRKIIPSPSNYFRYGRALLGILFTHRVQISSLLIGGFFTRTLDSSICGARSNLKLILYGTIIIYVFVPYLDKSGINSGCTSKFFLFSSLSPSLSLPLSFSAVFACIRV